MSCNKSSCPIFCFPRIFYGMFDLIFLLFFCFVLRKWESFPVYTPFCSVIFAAYKERKSLKAGRTSSRWWPTPRSITYRIEANKKKKALGWAFGSAFGNRPFRVENVVDRRYKSATRQLLSLDFSSRNGRKTFENNRRVYAPDFVRVATFWRLLWLWSLTWFLLIFGLRKCKHIFLVYVPTVSSDALYGDTHRHLNRRERKET